MTSDASAPRILCIGMPVRDLVFAIDDVPSRGEKVNAGGYSEITGGNALNAAISIRRLGLRAALCGPMGDANEPSHASLFRDLAQEGIAAEHLVHMPGLVTPISSVMIDPGGERTIVTFRDPALWRVTLPEPDVLLRDCAAVLVESRCAPFATDLCIAARARGLPVVVDVDRAMSPGEGLLTAASHLVFSSEALRGTAGIADDAGALRRLAALTKSFLAATRGPHGTLWLDADGALRETPAFPVHTVDTLGAGDIFHGAFTVGLVEQQTIPETLRFASAAAALKCTRHGGAFAAPHRVDVTDFLARQAA